jgi:hypothetical protein
MKFIFPLVIAAISITTSCNKKSSEIPVNDVFDSITAIIRYEGAFKRSPYGTVSGTVRVYESNGKWQLRLVGFNTSNGPDLKVYLSKEIQPINFIKVGDLKSVAGNQSYEITSTPDFMQYRFALIHCEQYNHLFGSAELVKQ